MEKAMKRSRNNSVDVAPVETMQTISEEALRKAALVVIYIDPDATVAQASFSGINLRGRVPDDCLVCLMRPGERIETMSEEEMRKHGWIRANNGASESVELIDPPVRVQLRRTKGWRMPPNTVKVDRSTKWGNAHTLVWCCACHDVHDTIEQCIAEFRAEVFGNPLMLASVRTELKGKNLACWCRLDQPCHADVLLEAANTKHERLEENAHG